MMNVKIAKVDINYNDKFVIDICLKQDGIYEGYLRKKDSKKNLYTFGIDSKDISVEKFVTLQIGNVIDYIEIYNKQYR